MFLEGHHSNEGSVIDKNSAQSYNIWKFVEHDEDGEGETEIDLELSVVARESQTYKVA